MVAIFILSLALLAGGTSALHLDQVEVALNGTTNMTTLEQFPSIVQVDFQDIWGWGGWNQNCAGSVLTSRWMLTAASCFSGQNYNRLARRIRAGASFRNTGGQIVYVDFEVNYPDNSTSGTFIIHDMSVVRLSSPLFFSNLIRQAAILGSGIDLPLGLVINQVGWGQKNISSNALTSAPIRIVSWFHPTNGTQSTIFGGQPSANASTNGDVGAPWFFNNVTVGVVAGLNANVTWTPYIYGIAVSPYTKWIVSVAV